jgi:hypothetical protein
MVERGNSLHCRLSLAAAITGMALAALTAALLGAMAVGADAGSSPRTPALATGSISGAVSYVGAVTGTHLVWVGAFTTTLGGPPVAAVR